jgi:hypothetical protein
VPAVSPSQYNQDPQAFAVGSNGEIFVAASNGVYASTDDGKSFHETGWPIAHPSFVAVGPPGSDVIFVGEETQNADRYPGDATAGALDYTTDGGTTWQQSDLNGAAGYPMTLSFNPTNPNDLLLGMSDGPQDGGGILESTNAGRSFKLDNQGISVIPHYFAQTGYPAIWQVSYAPGSDLAVAATSNGLYALRSGTSKWATIRANAAPFMFTGIAWSNGDVYVSTMGEGVLEAPVSSLSAP